MKKRGEKKGVAQDIVLTEQDKSTFGQTMDYVRDWCSEHQWEIGVAEMAAGAAIIAYGVQNGAIEMGKDVIGTAFSNNNMGENLGAAAGVGIGGVGGAIVGSIGIAAMGGAIGIPALVMIGGGSLILGAAGYTVGDLAHKFLNPPVDPGQFLAGCSILAVGAALMLDGARRVVTDDRVLNGLSSFKDGVIHLSEITVGIVARSLDDLKAFMNELASVPDSAVDATGTVIATTVLTAGGLVIGTTAASATVTVFGSSALGAAALTLGLISAPIWPVLAGGGAGLAVGYTTWKAIKFWGGKAMKRM